MCSVCPTVFGAQDSYYEHDGQVYCHYHYSTQFAQRCNGCQTAILKQFVEIFRNGQNQHWHPECYMIHKFWNVRLASSQDAVETRPALKEIEDEAGRNAVKDEEERMEEKVYRIWSVLSTFEESSAACISDMLLHVSNGAYVDGVMVAKKFIMHVDMLFSSADKLDATMTIIGMKGIVFFFARIWNYRLIIARTFVLSRSKALVQKDSRLLFSPLQDARNWRSKAWCYPRTARVGHRSSSLPETSDSDMPAGVFKGRTRTEELRRATSVPGRA
jgi:hypothetical protein